MRGPAGGSGPATARHASSSRSVPCTLTSASLRCERCEAISAARCITQSGRSWSRACARRAPSPRSASTARVPGGSDPGRRTSASTSCPRSSSSSQSTPPMKPLAPVTSTRIPARAYPLGHAARSAVLHLEGRPAAGVDELLEPVATVADYRSPVCEEHVAEVELLEQVLARGEQRALGGGGIVHQGVGYEAQRTVLCVGPALDDAIRQHDRLIVRQVQGRVVGADRIDLPSDGTAGKRVADLEAQHRLAVRELVQARAVAVDRAAEALGEATCFAIVVAVREQDRRGCQRAVGEPVQSLTLRHQRVDQNAGVLEPVGGHLDVDSRMQARPVEDAREHLLHWRDSTRLRHRKTIQDARRQTPGAVSPPTVTLHFQSLLACAHEIVPAGKPETRHTSIRQSLQPPVDANAPLLTQDGPAKEGERTEADGP